MSLLAYFVCVFASVLVCVFASVLVCAFHPNWCVLVFLKNIYVSRKLDLTLEAHFFQLTMQLFNCCLSFSDHFRHMREKD